MKGSFLILAVVVAAVITSIGLASLASAGHVEPAAACVDPRGCPDLLVDGRKLNQWNIKKATFSETDCAVVEGSTQPGERLLLRFTYNTPNLGSGDLVIGNPSDHPEWFDLSLCHEHLHFREYADYRLWSPAGYDIWKELRGDNPEVPAGELLSGHPELQQYLVVGAKRGFCVIDFAPAGPAAGRPNYKSCRSNQGISAGWADEYPLFLPGQWIDITGVPAGTYVLEAEVNAEHFFQETDYSNNASAIVVEVPNRPGRTR